jgi:hypothetical protein
MEPDAQLDLRAALAEAWAELVIAEPEDREAARQRYHALLAEFTKRVMNEKPEG